MQYLYGCNLANSGGMWWDCGPYERPTTFHRAVMLMDQMERAKQTDHWVYVAARVIAYNTMGGTDAGTSMCTV